MEFAVGIVRDLLNDSARERSRLDEMHSFIAYAIGACCNEDSPIVVPVRLTPPASAAAQTVVRCTPLLGGEGFRSTGVAWALFPTLRVRNGSAYGPAREHFLSNDTVPNDENSVDQHIAHALRGQQLLEGRTVDNPVGVEQDDVRVGTYTYAPFVALRRNSRFEPLGRHEGHLAESFHEGQNPPLADVVP